MEINLDLLAIQNPWWLSGKIKFDPVILSYHRHTLAKSPEWINEISLKEPAIYTVYGARGLGKTTGFKLIIEKLIKDGIEPQNIFYYSCYNIGTYEQLNEIIKLFISSRPPTGQRLYIFIDEISIIKNWGRGIEFLRQAGKFKNVNLLLSVSRSKSLNSRTKIDEIKNNNLITIHSRDFCDFIKTINPRLGENVVENNYAQYNNKLEYYLDAYLLTGGFATTINSFKSHGAVDQKIYEDYLLKLSIDMAQSNRDIILWHQIMEKAVGSLGQTIGHQTIARRTKAKTHLTVGEYLDLMEQMFVTETVYQGDKFGRAEKSKAKKIFFTDPFLFWIFYCHTYGSLDNWQFSRERLHQKEIFNNLIENIVFNHLAKIATDQKEERIMFWRDNIKKQDIDFIIKIKKAIYPVLIRYNQNTSEKDINLFSQAGFKRGIIISQDQLEIRGEIQIIPLVYFLLFYKNLLK
jgi:predicted AAA+ superfamily ATPase